MKNYLMEQEIYTDLEKRKNTLKIKFKKLVEAAITPTYSKVGDAGLDLTAVNYAHTDKYSEYGTGIAVAIPEGFVGLLFPRSSVTNKDLMLKNSVGVIDPNYRGEVKLRFARTGSLGEGIDLYELGERCGQLIVVPRTEIELEEVTELEESNRGVGGFGSSGK